VARGKVNKESATFEIANNPRMGDARIPYLPNTMRVEEGTHFLLPPR